MKVMEIQNGTGNFYFSDFLMNEKKKEEEKINITIYYSISIYIIMFGMIDQRELHPPHRAQRAVRAERSEHQFHIEERREVHAGQRAVLQHADFRDAGQRGGPYLEEGRAGQDRTGHFSVGLESCAGCCIKLCFALK